jgi:hypothetical protein
MLILAYQTDLKTFITITHIHLENQLHFRAPPPEDTRSMATQYANYQPLKTML